MRSLRSPDANLLRILAPFIAALGALRSTLRRGFDVLEKKTPEISKKAQILNVYLTGGMMLLSEKLSDPTSRAGLQVFILGMADMLRQAEKLSWEDFVAIYSSVLDEHNILPETPVEEFINKIGGIASTNDEVSRVMKQGAQSISMYVAEKDANAPTDLLGAVLFAEKNKSSFAEIHGRA